MVTVSWCLQVAELSHSVTSPMSFRVEYKRGSAGPAVFQRHVRFQVDITPVYSPNDPNPLYAINFILLSGMMGNKTLQVFRSFCFTAWAYLYQGETAHHHSTQTVPGKATPTVITSEDAKSITASFGHQKRLSVQYWRTIHKYCLFKKVVICKIL